ncbi:MAG: hypothetical protein U0893_14285 [Chloroflexota bacterium]
MDVAWWSMFVIWMLYACAIRSQQEFAAQFSPNHHDDRGKMLKLAVIGSVLVAALVSIGLVYLHYSAFGLLWTLVLSVGGSILAAALWGVLSSFIDDLLLALAGFGVWPLSAVGMYVLIGVAER